MVIVKNKYPKQTQNKIWRGLLAMGSDSLWGSRQLPTVLFFSSDGLVPFWCGVCAFDWSSTNQRSTTTRSGHNKVGRINHSRFCVSVKLVWDLTRFAPVRSFLTKVAAFGRRRCLLSIQIRGVDTRGRRWCRVLTSLVIVVHLAPDHIEFVRSKDGVGCRLHPLTAWFWVLSLLDFNYFWVFLCFIQRLVGFLNKMYAINFKDKIWNKIKVYKHNFGYNPIKKKLRIQL